MDRLILDNGRIMGASLGSTSLTAQTVILATGGASYPGTGSTGDGYRFAEAVGHKVIPIRPALVPLTTAGNAAQKCQGLSLRNVSVTVWTDGKKTDTGFGEMLFTHFGVSGPIILTLSGKIVDSLRKKQQVQISIDLKPALDEQKLDFRLQRELSENGKKQIRNVMKNLLPSKLIPVILSKSDIDEFKECHQISGKERKKIKTLLKDLRFEISGYRSFKEAIITAGGIELNDIDSKTMMSKLIKNLYFAGEIIDLDAETGGYNFQAAWTTAFIAAKLN